MVTVDGIISGQTVDQAGNNMVDVIQAQLDRAKDDRRVKAVILKVDSPGGEVLASDEIYRAINDFQKDSEQTGHLFHGQSGRLGRLLHLVALPLDCGQRPDHHRQHRRDSAHVELSRVDGQNRLRPEVFKSGKFKDMLSGERETNEIPAEERVMVQGLIDETYQKFKDVVAAGPRRRARQEQKGRPPAGAGLGQLRRRPRAVRHPGL